MNAKKIMIIVSISLLAATLILSIITLVNYYSYVNVLNKLTDPATDLLSKFELQESRDTYLYRTLSILIWTCYVSITTAVVSIITAIMHRSKTNSLKIR